MKIFITIILIIDTITQDCDNFKTNYQEECFRISDNCCYIDDYRKVENSCMIVNDTSVQSIRIDDKNIEYNTICGLSNPLSEIDCTGSSIENNSCCYFTSRGKKGCFWLGEKREGVRRWKDLTIQCISEFINISYILIIILIIF